MFCLALRYISLFFFLAFVKFASNKSISSMLIGFSLATLPKGEIIANLERIGWWQFLRCYLIEFFALQSTLINSSLQLMTKLSLWQIIICTHCQKKLVNLCLPLCLFFRVIKIFLKPVKVQERAPKTLLFCCWHRDVTLRGCPHQAIAWAGAWASLAEFYQIQAILLTLWSEWHW